MHHWQRNNVVKQFANAPSRCRPAIKVEFLRSNISRIFRVYTYSIQHWYVLFYLD